MQILKRIESRQYICPGTERIKLPDPSGEIDYLCRVPAAVAKTEDQRVLICPGFFTPEVRPIDQGAIILHEWAHRGKGVSEEIYDELESSMLDIDKALTNAESYVLLAHWVTYNEIYKIPANFY